MVLASGKMRRWPRRTAWCCCESGFTCYGRLDSASDERATDARRAIDGVPVRRFLSYERAGSDNAG